MTDEQWSVHLALMAGLATLTGLSPLIATGRTPTERDIQDIHNETVAGMLKDVPENLRPDWMRDVVSKRSASSAPADLDPAVEPE